MTHTNPRRPRIREDDEITHHEGEAIAIERVFEVMSEQGLEGMTETMQTLLNEAMKFERSESVGGLSGVSVRE